MLISYCTITFINLSLLLYLVQLLHLTPTSSMKYLFIFLFSVISSSGFSQCMGKPVGNSKIAKNYMAFGQFNCALEEYLIMFNEKPESIKYNRFVAEAYSGIPGSAGKGAKYMEFVINKGKYSEDDLFLLAYAYHQNAQFQKAITTCERYLNEFTPIEIELTEIEVVLSNSKSALELIKFPISVKFENLGKRVNTKWEDKNPFVTPLENIVTFQTSRNNVMGGYTYGNGYVDDVFITKLKGKKYSKPKSIGSMFNSVEIENLAGYSQDSRHLFISSDAQGFQIFDLKMSYMKPRARSFPKPLPLKGINNTASNEKEACITNDGSIIIFSSDREGGFGGYDLYISRKLPNGEWGTPQNLGSTINTKTDENFPIFNEDEDGITFASMGHLTMGGYDIFSSSFSSNYTKWTPPLNLGYPINTQFDDYTIQFLHKNRLAYKSHYDTTGFGMSDLYRLVFLDSTPQLSIINLVITLEEEIQQEVRSLKGLADSNLLYLDSLVNNDETMDSLSIVSITDSINVENHKIQEQLVILSPNCFTEVTVSNSETEEEYGIYKSNQIKGGILMILEPGKYDLSIKANGFKPLNKSLIIEDKNKFQKFIDKKFMLKKKH